MNTEQIKRSIIEKKICLSGGEKIEYWLNLLFISTPLIAGVYTLIEEMIRKEESSILVFILIGLLLLLLRHVFQHRNLDVYISKLTEKQFKEANKATAILNGWGIISNRNNYFSAVKQTNWQSEGITVTAILKDGKIYLNSMVTPSIRSNPFTFGMNKKNKLKLVNQYQSILKGNDVLILAEKEIKKREEAFWNESEWTLLSTVKRIIGYGISIPLIILSIWFISQGEIWGSLYGVLMLWFCGSYIFYDAKIIIDKLRRKKDAK